MPRSIFKLLTTILLITLVGLPAAAREPDSKKLQVFILAGQSNMVGHCSYHTLPRLLSEEEPEVQALGKQLFKDGQQIEIEDVKKYYVLRKAANELNQQIKKKEITGEQAIDEAKAKISEIKSQMDAMDRSMMQSLASSDRVYITAIADNNRGKGPLSVGFGGSKEKLGPELGFGMTMAQKIDSPILIIKASWGGKSLEYDFRPPSAGAYQLLEKQQEADNKDEIKKNAGHFYRLMTEHVNESLANLKDLHPDYDPKAGYEIAGFVWFQGYNDQFSDQYRDNYASNMVHFVKDVRKEFNATDMPFVIGVLGTGRTEEKVAENQVSLGQRAAAQDPSIKDNAVAVESYKFWDWKANEIYDKGWYANFPEWGSHGSDRPYHYLGSGKFFLSFGDKLADEMYTLIKKQ